MTPVDLHAGYLVRGEVFHDSSVSGTHQVHSLDIELVDILSVHSDPSGFCDAKAGQFGQKLSDIPLIAIRKGRGGVLGGVAFLLDHARRDFGSPQFGFFRDKFDCQELRRISNGRFPGGVTHQGDDGGVWNRGSGRLDNERSVLSGH